jgi:dihydroflavonol-4-reductase
MSGRVLITGGTGFVGGLVLARLVADGRRVRALVRHPVDRERLPDPRVELALGHLEDEESLARAADGCEVVYHLAGLNQLCLADPTPLYRVNVEGTRRMLEAARRAGVRRVVHTSSAATLGGDGSSVLDETAAPPAEFTSHYARSKFEAEQVALDFRGVEVVAVNPSSVQGPGRTTGTATVFIGYLNGRLPFDLPARFGLCYTRDCVNGHLLAEDKGRPGQRYVLNTATVTNREAIDLIAVIAGLADRPRTLPLPVAMGVAAVAEALARARGRQPRLCRESVRTVGHPHLYDGSRATRELGLRYTPLREAMETTVRWYVAQRLVTRPLPRFSADVQQGPGDRSGSPFEPPPGRQREPSP